METTVPTRNGPVMAAAGLVIPSTSKTTLTNASTIFATSIRFGKTTNSASQDSGNFIGHQYQIVSRSGYHPRRYRAYR